MLELDATPIHVSVPVQPLAVRVTLSVPHTSALLGVNTGAAGLSPVVMVTLTDAGLTPQIFSHVAV